MENQRPANRRRKEAAAGSMEEDRISQLPEPILDHVIYFLPQKDAVRTCLLSKSWRHLGPTRRNIKFCESDFRRRSKKKKFMSVLENNLQRYVDQKLPIEEFILNMSGPDPKRPIEEFILSMLGPDSSNNPCSLLNKWVVKLHMLKRLSLKLVYIEEETFEKIMSSCPLIQHLVLEKCYGLKIVRVNKAPNLKQFNCYDFEKNCSIEIDDSPSLETMRISSCWYHLHNNNYFYPRLKSLYLWDVHLITELLNNLSSKNCPSLEVLELSYCSGFTEKFKLSNRSIKRLIINIPDCPIKAAIHAANMLYFEFKSGYLPSMISFAETSRECKSRIYVWRAADSNAGVLSTWSMKLHEFLKALSHTQISLDTFPLLNQDTCDDNGCELVMAEHWYLRSSYPSHDEDPTLLNCMFRICRPRYIYACSQKIYGSPLAESIWKTLVNKGETRECGFWQQDLEESSIQVSDKKTNVWRPGKVCALSNKEEIRFRLKWRDLS